MIAILRDHTTVCSISDDNAVLTQAIMGKDEVTLSVIVPEVLPIEVGDAIELSGMRYTLNRLPDLHIVSDVEYNYTLVFEAPCYHLFDKMLVYPITGQTTFYLTGTARDFIGLIVDNANEADSGWEIGEIPTSITKNLLFEDCSCQDALAQVASAFSLEFYIQERRIHLTERVERITSHVFEQGMGCGLYSLQRKNVDTDNTVTRAYVFGGSQNLPLGYRNGADRICLPEKYVEDFSEYPRVVERSATFEDVFPHFEGTVHGVAGANNEVITCPEIDFDLNQSLIGGVTAKINFLSGDLMGIDFELTYRHNQREVTLIRKEDERTSADSDGKRPLIPNDTIKPAAGDKFNFTDIVMPQAYVDAAEQQLRTRGLEWLNQNSQLRVTYSLEVDYRHLRREGITLLLGDVIRIRVPGDGIDKLLRIISLEKNLHTGALSCEVSNYIRERWDKQIEAEIRGAREEFKFAEFASLEATKEWVGRNFHPILGRDYMDFTARDIAAREVAASGDISAGGSLDVQRTTTKELEVTARAAFGGNTQSNNYVQGSTGVGWNIDNKGNGELHSLVLRMFLETPELRKNKISVIGDEFWVTTSGLIENVQKTDTLPVYTKDGRQIMGKGGKPWMLNVGNGYVLRFKLEEGDVHAFKKDDILVSKFDQPDGFQTAWFRVKYVLTGGEVFVTPCNGYAPQVAMSVARQGNFTNPERQNSIYIDGRNGYIRVLSGVNSTEIKPENIRCQYGNLNGLTVPDIGSLHGYGEYSDNAYKRGVFLMQGGQRVEDFVRDAVDALQGSLGGLAFKDKVEKALLGDTIISGGFIKSDLIAVDDALVGRLIANEAFIAKLTTSEAFIDKLVARQISTQVDPDNPRRVDINKGYGAIEIFDKNNNQAITIDDGSTYGGPNGNGLIYMTHGEINSHLSADRLEIRNNIWCTTYGESRIDIFESDDGGLSYLHQALFGAEAIVLPRGANINMPGVLAAGRAGKSGNKGYMWGCKSAGIGIGIRINGVAGKYHINHYLGHTNYTTTVTAAGTPPGWEITAQVIEETDDYVEVWMRDNGDFLESDFNFTIIGDK